MSSLIAQKKSLRSAMRHVLRAMSEAERAAKSRAILACLQRQRFWKTAQTVVFFYPLPDEVDLRALWKIAPEKHLCLPRVAGDALEIHRVEDSRELRFGKIAEPDPAKHPRVALADIDLVLVPGLAFSRDGGRLGRGGGYYDRFLSEPALRAIRCGIAFDFQRQAVLPVEAHDVSLDCILTNESILFHTVRRP